MIDKLQHFSDYYLVTCTVDRSKSKTLVQAAIDMGVKPTFVTNARGLMHGKQVGFFKLSGISPSLDTLYLLVPGAHVDTVMNNLIKTGKLDHFGGGAIYASRLHDLWLSGTDPFSGSPASLGSAHEFQKDLVAITCISQRGMAEEIARGAMAAGSYLLIQYAGSMSGAGLTVGIVALPLAIAIVAGVGFVPAGRLCS